MFFNKDKKKGNFVKAKTPQAQKNRKLPLPHIMQKNQVVLKRKNKTLWLNCNVYNKTTSFKYFLTPKSVQVFCLHTFLDISLLNLFLHRSKEFLRSDA